MPVSYPLAYQLTCFLAQPITPFIENRKLIINKLKLTSILKTAIKYILILILAVCASMNVSAGGNWRLHSSYDGNLQRLIDTPDYLYILSYPQRYSPGSSDYSILYLSLFCYDKEADELQWLNIDNRLSATNVRIAEYNPSGKYLMVAYADGNIDIIRDNGKVENIPDLKIADSNFTKNINSIAFAKDKDLAYIATDFGYITIDTSKKSVVNTRNFYEKFLSVGVLGNKLIVARNDGLYIGDPGDYNLSDFKKFANMQPVTRMLSYGDKVFTVANNPDNGASYIGYITPDGSSNATYHQWITRYHPSLELTRDRLMVASGDEIELFDNNLTPTKLKYSPVAADARVGSWDGTSFWIDKKRDGISLQKAAANGANTQWTLLKEKLFPNSANAFKASSITYHPKYGVLVRNHGIDRNFGGYSDNVPDLISAYKGMTWTPLSATYRAPGDALTVWNPLGITIDPRDSEAIYNGSMLHGMFRLNLSDPSKSLRFAGDKDSYISDPRVAAIVSTTNKWSGFPKICNFSQPKFDAYGNLWVVYYDYDNYASTGPVFFYWTPEDRIATTSAAGLRPMKKWTNPNLDITNRARIFPLLSQANKNYIVYSPMTSSGIFLYLIDHKGTLDTRADDVVVSLDRILDQDGNLIETNYLKALYEDPSTGLVWIGTNTGLFYFKPSEMIAGKKNVTRIKVARNDGTNLADYLLDQNSVNDITVDSRGRKWFATHGGLVCTSANGMQVLNSYDDTNSDLPSSIVYSLCYNPDNNSIMVSTDEGLAELFLSSGGDGEEDSDKAKAYPNPVRPDYFGYVTIENLDDNALVKITDGSGNLIKELGFAEGGTAQWDVTNFNNKRVKSGVYYVLASGGPDQQDFTRVAKILVVN